MAMDKKIDAWFGSAPVNMPPDPLYGLPFGHKKTALEEMTLFEFQDKYYDHSPGDSDLWLTLFMWSDSRIGEALSHLLLEIRNTGTILAPDVKFGYVILPVFGEYGWPTKAAFDKKRWSLQPYEGKLKALLKQLAEEDEK